MAATEKATDCEARCNAAEASLKSVRGELHAMTQSLEAASESANGAAKRHEEELGELQARNEIALREAAHAANKMQSAIQAQLDAVRAELCTEHAAATAAAAAAATAAEIGSQQVAALEQALLDASTALKETRTELGTTASHRQRFHNK